MSLFVSPDTATPASASCADRRVHPRLKASELGGLVSVRVKYGSEVRLIDLSVGGVLIETSDTLSPDANVIFEFAGPHSTLLVPSRAVRIHPLSHLDDSGRYEGAFAFKRPLPLSDLLKEPTDQWHTVVARCRDGRIVQGHTNDFQPARRTFRVYATPFAEAAREVAISDLDAVFFLRDGAPAGSGASQGLGRRVAVTLQDGEELVGTTTNYRRDGTGFVVHAAGNTSTVKVFVAHWAVRHLRWL